MKITNSLAYLFSHPEKQITGITSEALCEPCWGYQQYNGEVRILFKDKQIDVNNYKTKYMFIRRFVVTHINGIKLKKALTKLRKKR
ncbi:hypothetical protein GGR27_002485 [Lewinella antarctica]|uniref:LAGLIDADG homing endonuclease n=1 Tax=Neolewinella antarctica TaxID=442734 RepID=A0ABX0XD19_9BACT|nr:hypothetical protein [Neolewinella antarctica]